VIPFQKSRVTLPKKQPIIHTRGVACAIALNGVLSPYISLGSGRANLTKAQARGLKSLRKRLKNGEIRISVSDKGGEFVVCETELDIAITQQHLSDQTTYEKATQKDFEKLLPNINKTWSDIYAKAGGTISKDLFSRLITRDCTPPCLYTLIMPLDAQKTSALWTLDPLKSDPYYLAAMGQQIAYLGC
jgi:exonuclease III